MLPKSLEKCIRGRGYFLKPPLHWVQDFDKTYLVFRSQPVRGGPNLLEGLLVKAVVPSGEPDQQSSCSEGFSNSAGGEDFGC